MANISETSINRPVLSTVMMLVILLFGFIGYRFLGVREFPSVDQPIISVNVSYPGANADVIMNQITEPLEQNINGIPGIRSLSSVSSQGSSRITVEFELSVDMETAANDVRDKVSRAQRYLPRDCDPPTVSKADADASPIMQIAIRSNKRSLMELSEIAELTVKERLQTIENVSGVDIWGQKRYSMRLWLDPIKMADVNLRFTKPEARIEIDRDKASLLGVSTRNIAQTLQYALSGQRMGYFYMNGKQYQILGEINRQQRNTPVDLKSIYVRSNNGEMIQLDNLVKVTENVAPPQLYRYNRFVSATVSSGLNKGYTIGDGLDEMDRIASEVLDGSFRTALSGESKEFRESSSSLMFAMILALLMIYLVLAAQFESFKDPLVVMFTVPLAIAGALMFMSYSGITMNIFSQIGIIMLIGLVAKNGILIVEFANQRQESGLSLPEAIRSSATQRLRPILMTSVSTILGLVPLVYATGEGAQGRIAMGVAVVGGMLVSTFLTLFIVPAMYSFISTNRKKNITE